MRIGSLEIKDGLILAPMAGVTNSAYRHLVKEMGCPLVFTEMISAEGLIRNKEGLLRIEKSEHPIIVQIFGSNPTTMASAAEIAAARGADAIDINMGCPAKHVVEAGAGVDLMRFPGKAKAVLSEVRRAIRVPLTIKIRSGWDRDQVNAIEICLLAEDCGVNAITIHPRTKAQGFRGKSDWNLIREIKQAVTIPVIGNGDVTTPSLARKMMEETNCDAVMIGRGALGNPWIFNAPFLASLERTSSPISFLRERRRIIERHFFLLQEFYGEARALKEIRKHLFWYTKGLPQSSSFRHQLPELRGRGALLKALDSYFERLERKEECQSSR